MLSKESQYPVNNGTRPKLIARYVVTHKTIGTLQNGIIIIGFKTIGIPKITGSLILNIAAGPDNLATVFNSGLFAPNQIETSNDNVAPVPPAIKYTSLNC